MFPPARCPNAKDSPNHKPDDRNKRLPPFPFFPASNRFADVSGANRRRQSDKPFRLHGAQQRHATRHEKIKRGGRNHAHPYENDHFQLHPLTFLVSVFFHSLRQQHADTKQDQGPGARKQRFTPFSQNDQNHFQHVSRLRVGEHAAPRPVCIRLQKTANKRQTGNCCQSSFFIHAAMFSPARSS